MSEAEDLKTKFRQLAKEIVMQAIRDCLIDAEANNQRLEELAEEMLTADRKRRNVCLRTMSQLREQNDHKNDAINYFKSGNYRYWLGKSEYNGESIKKFLIKEGILNES